MPSRSPLFTRDLVPNMRNQSDVRKLQELLARDPHIYPERLVTGNYFQLTEAAVKRFQAQENIPQTGIVNAPTRAALERVYNAPVVSAHPPAGGPPLFTKDLSRNTRDQEVRRLQQFLNKDPNTRVAVSGFGSPGQETDWFGVLTEAALEKLQSLNNLLVTGRVDAATRAFLNRMQGSGTTVSTPTPQAVPPLAAPSPAASPLGNEEAARQIQDIMRQIEELQRMIEMLQRQGR